MIDINKKYKLRNGCEVVIYKIYTDPNQTYPVHGAYKNTNGAYVLCNWTNMGNYVSTRLLREENTRDIVLIPETFDFGTKWVNVYPNQISYKYDTKLAADKCASLGRIACIQIHLKGTIGEGL